MKAVTLEENIERLNFLKSEGLSIANEQEKIALSNDVVLFETEQEKKSFVDGFVNGVCYEIGRKDADVNNTLKEILTLFHLQETKDWEQKCVDILIKYKNG